MKKRLLNKFPLISNKTKILISTFLLTLSFVLFILRSEHLDSKICFIGMFFSFIGDIVLNCKPLDKRSHLLLYTGALFFMISHLVYAQAYHLMITQTHNAYLNFGSAFAIVVILLILFVSTWRIYHKKKNVKLSMLCIFAIYFFVISINFITIYSYSWSFKSLSFAGATSFLISDYIIGIESVFKIKSDTLRKLVWIFYPIGQIMILCCR